MNSMPEHDWQPDPQLLAAYFDGELEDSADVRARIENWLATHPDDAQDWHELKKFLRDTAPAEPSEATWQSVRERIKAVPQPRSRRPWLAAAVIAASVVLGVGVLFGAWRSLRTPDQTVVKSKLPDDADFEVYPIASASEVTILRIESADMDGIVVGSFPVSGPMEWADPGEVSIKCKCPRVCIRQEPPDRPMVWARAD
jgi:hypothetical protein